MDRRLIDFLNARPRPPGSPGRLTPRAGARATAALRWRADAAERTVEARLLDVGRGGASLAVADPPPAGAAVLVRLVKPEGTGWLEGEVLGVESRAEGGHLVRLRFADWCPAPFLKTAVFGRREPGAGEGC